jgi:hypothetical protein
MVKSTYSMKVFNSIEDIHFWRFILGHRVICGQLFCTKHLVVQHIVDELHFMHLIGGGELHYQQTQRI